jgi:hypothetical protein
LEPVREAIRPLIPEGGLLSQPSFRLAKSVGLDRYPMFSAPHFAADQARSLKHADVARDASEGHGQRPGEVGDAGVAVSQCHEQGSTGGIRQSAIGTVEDLIFNHLV